MPHKSARMDPESEKEIDQRLMKEHNVTETQLAELKECFSLFDKNDDGVITPQELGTVLRAMGQNPTNQELTQMIDEIDLNENGTVSFEEYVKVVGLRGIKSESELEEEMTEALKVFDKDGNGYIDASELRNVLTTLGEPVTEEDIKEMLKLADVKDGKFSYRELVYKVLGK